ncbi:hypothetical protein WJX75_000167 [Coccomyxa subellipsoidea]|uniref:ARM repeat-containing protein n=1 Tax=Coccomyxa subellipsoidea TaxID=248742 RepID=A0ABR2YY18_9CHLO
MLCWETEAHGGSCGCGLKMEERACQRLLRLLVDTRAEKVAELVFDCQPEAYAALFMTSKADNVMLWFDHFTQDSRGHFQYGAKALAQYALRKREEVWDLLMAIFAVASFKDLDELLLFNALALRSGQILRVLQQDTAQQARQGILKKLKEGLQRMTI